MTMSFSVILQHLTLLLDCRCDHPAELGTVYLTIDQSITQSCRLATLVTLDCSLLGLFMISIGVHGFTLPGSFMFIAV